MEQLPPAFEGLAPYRQFIVYMLVPSVSRPGSTDKVPINPFNLMPTNPLDPENWYSANDAIKHANSLNMDAGIGFVFTHQDPFFFLDIDKCLLPDNKWSPRAQQLLDYFQGAAIEVSQSGKGLHIIGSGVCPPHGCKNKAEGLELYTEARFVALTGNFTEGSVLANMSQKLPWLVENFFTKVARDAEIEWSHQPVPEWNGPWDDDVLINKALSTVGGASTFGNKAAFADLFNANAEVLGNVYPHETNAFDQSSADIALALHLAFWTGKNHERIKNIMLRSALVRDKWDREKYLHDTIVNACALATDVYSINYKAGGATLPPINAISRVPPSPPAGLALPGPGVPAVPTTATLPAIPGSTNHEIASAPGVQFMPASQQPEYFRGCVYIRDSHTVLTPDGARITPDRFRAMFGGYTFAMDMTNNKTTKSAWEVFIESQAFKFPKATRHVFRPEVPPLKVFEEEGETVVNSYVPIATKRRKGDPAPFLGLLEKLLPMERDRQIILSYMAAVVQYPGVKFQWCPILQGAEGNGKSTILRCVAFAVGYRYSHFPSATDLANKFNSWVAEKLFIGINEIYVGDQRDIRDTLYPMITDTELEVQRKGSDKERIDNRANFMATSNHKEAVRVTKDTRRWAVFYTAQQTEADLHRYGMTGTYFPVLRRWLETEGFEIVNDFLREYQIVDEFNPATLCVRAPTTTASTEAREVTQGSIEQEIQEAIELGLPGFRGGWVSSIKLDELLENRRLARFIPRHRRRELMQVLGYDWHPALAETNGRVHTPVLQESGKPVLYSVKAGMAYAADPIAARLRYMADQGYDATPNVYPIGAKP